VGQAIAKPVVSWEGAKDLFICRRSAKTSGSPSMAEPGQVT